MSTTANTLKEIKLHIKLDTLYQILALKQEVLEKSEIIKTFCAILTTATNDKICHPCEIISHDDL
jgi:hypothetical protein